MSIITASDIAAKRKAIQALELAKSGKLIKVLFLLSRNERSAGHSIRTWCSTQGVVGQIRYGDLTKQQVSAFQKEGKFDFVAITNPVIFKELRLGAGNQDDWAGAMLPEKILILPSLVTKQKTPKARAIPEFSWELEHYLAKLKTYIRPYNYRYTICSNKNQLVLAIAEMESAYIISADIETNLANIVVSCAFTPVSAQGRIGHTYVIKLVAWNLFEESYKAMRTILATLAHKCFHNGTFDNTMLMRHWLPCRNYTLDTEYLWHSYQAETRKSLKYICGLLLPDYIYWKDEADTNLLEYNAKDSINTARILLWMLKNLPDYAWHNYSFHVPKFVPTVICNLEGFAVDHERLKKAKTMAEAEVDKSLKTIQAILALPDFNPGSPKQLASQLYEHLGPAFGWTKPATNANKKRARTGVDVSATDAISLRALQLQHPVAARLIEELLVWRKHSKALSTYFNSYLYKGRLYYTFNLDGTSTDRYSCSASLFRLVTGYGSQGQIRVSDIKNYGNQIQNSPPYYKKALCADPGYLICNIDKSKSEAHCVALISGDPKFTEAIKDTATDFYLKLASWFFGVDTDDKDHPIRQPCKKINHASSYCMGWGTFLDQVGIVKLQEYMRLVGWQALTKPKTFINHLLGDLFHGTFPGIGQWWKRTTLDLITTKGYLTTPDGCVRHFFSYPKSPTGISPPAVAHQPQHLSVATLNRDMCAVFWEIQLPTKFALRLKGQVHDSLVFQVKEEIANDLNQQVKALMEEPYPTNLGVLHIPCDADTPKKHWKE